MAQIETPLQEPTSINDGAFNPRRLWRSLFGNDQFSQPSVRADSSIVGNVSQGDAEEDSSRSGLIRRVSRKVVPGLPRAKTFKRQLSELRTRLEPVEPSLAEKRGLSVDRRRHIYRDGSITSSIPHASAPDFRNYSFSSAPSVVSWSSLPTSPVDEKMLDPYPAISMDMESDVHEFDRPSTADSRSTTSSQYNAQVHGEMERQWILNLSMHFRDRSRREKFFVTYYDDNNQARRVTISLDYRNAPEDSLEWDLSQTQYQRDKNAKIYEAIRDSLPDIQFYPTVTNLKLETIDGRLHVHVVEDTHVSRAAA
jgi:hypothetical protein